MQKGTISQVFDLFRSKKEAATATNRQSRDEFLLSLKNDNTHADEAATWIRCLLYLLTAFVVYLGYSYYLSTFSETMDPIVAAFFAVGIPIGVEIGKLKLITKAFRAISLGWIDEGPAKSLYWGMVLVIGGGAFWWSYTISTGGIKEVARQNAESSMRQDSLHVIIAASPSAIDNRIKEINQSNEQAAGMKTKKGKIAWSGQTIQMNNSATLASLQAERQKIVDQVTKDYSTTATQNKTKVSAWASFIERFGGWGELGSLFCLIALAVFERVLRDQNLKDYDNLENAAAAPHYQAPPTGHAPTFSQNGAHAAVKNTSSAQRTYYVYDNVPRNTVPQPPQTVAQQNGDNYADSVLEVCRQAVQRDLANFSNRQANNRTVAGRIHTALDIALEAMRAEGFNPTYKIGSKLYHYLQDKVWPTMNEVGHPYEHQAMFTHRLYAVFTADVPA